MSGAVAVHEISVSELRDLMNAAPPDAPIKLIDVREHDEWMSGHISGATLIPLGTVPERLDEFVGAPTYVICRSGGRSMHACRFGLA